MQNFIEIHQRNPELLSSGGFHPPPRLDRGIERPRLDRVKGELVSSFFHENKTKPIFYGTDGITDKH